MRPVRPSEITSVISEDFHGAQLARLITGIKNELSTAFRPDGGLLLFWFLLVHFAAGLESIRWGRKLEAHKFGHAWDYNR